jgi:hypothetical protein
MNHPAPFAAHYTSSTREGDELHLRVLFATEPEQEQIVRDRIDAALATGELLSPDGQLTYWRLRTCAPAQIRPDEADHAASLTR